MSDLLWEWSTSKGQVRISMPRDLSAADISGSIEMVGLMLNQWERWRKRQELIERQQDAAVQKTVSDCMAWMIEGTLKDQP